MPIAIGSFSGGVRCAQSTDYRPKSLWDVDLFAEVAELVNGLSIYSNW